MERSNYERIYVNIVHRPEMVPEYLQKEAEEGKAEDLTRSGVIQNRSTFFAPSSKSPTNAACGPTIQMTYASLFNAEAVAIARAAHPVRRRDRLDLPGDPVPAIPGQISGSKELAIWLFSMEDKRKIVDEVLGKFYEVFGFYPTSTGSYYMDASW